ncbi:thiamine phosphate synthase [Sulfobacillus thermosulfidooxidans]|uniref:thiamine phosphate synthase n=1 Tax=Sulfobacillus thermosulfidooxidans TaxID=28034 RepID=UPI0006B6894F|nr:thiamine phosphate synthase [Sulfobacillus thermosulfidooxidans]
MVIGVIDVPRFPHSAWSILPSLQGILDGLIVRDKEGLAPSVKSTALKIREIAPALPLWINSYVSVALSLPADGLALPANSAPAASLRSIWHKPIMASVHTLDELAYHQGADYYLWGHAFVSTSKPGLAPRSWSDLRQIVLQASAPVLVIGGITQDNVQAFRGMGIYGVCLSDGLWHEDNPIAACEKIKSHLHSSYPNSPGGTPCD